MMDKKAANAAFVEIARKGLEKFKCDPDGFYWYLKGALDAREGCCDTRGDKEDFEDSEILFVETITGQRFKSTKETIRKAERDLVTRINRELFASVNDWLDILGLYRSAIGDRMVWNVEHMPVVHFADGIDKDGNKVVCITYVNLPLPRIVQFDFY
jgi:hypothetical protein